MTATTSEKRQTSLGHGGEKKKKICDSSSDRRISKEAASYIPEEGRPPKDLDNWILFEANVGAHSKEADDYIPEEGRPPKNLDNRILLEEHSQLLD
ncbi:hypothetical protein PGT21_031038 [Puccinia graminis f. sp. tritici]|uniref:Uncharacterized protein n=1 Tax=Puccinia graminis f. sp. tritici TaxID=56615 RepID=A0A5B0NT92_PUCGR|nr:hypothetical protein PGT21_031038 [Puccinia graminis f. sp. tritici]